MVSCKALPYVVGNIMVSRCILVATLISLLVIYGCTDLTEFDHAIMAGVNIVSSSDLSVIHTMQSIDGARSLCVVPDGFLVATTEGFINHYDIDSYGLCNSFQVGASSPSGYFEMEYHPGKSSVYMIVGFGQIAEFSFPDLELVDNFSACENPVDIEIVTGRPYLYVAGVNSKTIYEVGTQTNTVIRSVTLLSTPTCMAIDHTQDTIFVGTLSQAEIVSTEAGMMQHYALTSFPKILAVKSIPYDTTLCAVFDYNPPWGPPLGEIGMIFGYFPPFGPLLGDWIGGVFVEGVTHHMCIHETGYYAFILSYTGNNMSRLVSYDCSNFSLINKLDLPGYPLDMQYGNGKLLVLTTD